MLLGMLGRAESFVTSITPLLGDNMIINGDFSAWTGGNPDSWTITKSAPNADITQVGWGEGRGGSGTGAVNLYNAVGSGANVLMDKPTALSEGLFYRLSVKRVIGQVAAGQIICGGQVGTNYYNILGSTSPETVAFDVFPTTKRFYILAGTGAIPDAAGYTIDDVSMIPVTGKAGKKTLTPDLSLEFPITMPVNGSSIGFVINADAYPNPQNCVLIFIHKILIGTSWAMYIEIFKQVSGTWTSVGGSGEVTYSAGKNLKVLKSGTLYNVYYNNVLKLVKTVADASIINNKICFQVSTNANNTFGAAVTSSTSGYHAIWGAGDSKTASIGTLGRAYFPYLAKAYEAPNRQGTPGYRWAQWYAAITTYLNNATPGTPEFVSLNLGINDVINGPMPADEADFLVSGQGIVDAVHAKWASAKIFIDHVWASVTAGGDTTKLATMNGYIDTLITSRNTFCYNGADERIIIENGDNGASRTSDGVHYNDVGCAVMAAAKEAAITAIVPTY